MNIGGTVTVRDVKVTMTQAVHSSAAGTPCGFIVTLEDGTVIYHAGDTGIFASMKLFGELYDLDVALLPIGSAFVMDPLQAAKALQLLQPKIAIPMHYKTFAALEQSPDSFLTLPEKKHPKWKSVYYNRVKQQISVNNAGAALKNVRSSFIIHSYV